MHAVNKIHIRMPHWTKKYAISVCFPNKCMSSWIIHEVGFRFDNPPERYFLSFKMHEITLQQFFGDGNRIMLIKSLRKDHAERLSLTLSARPTGPARQVARTDRQSTASRGQPCHRETP